MFEPPNNLQELYSVVQISSKAPCSQRNAREKLRYQEIANAYKELEEKIPMDILITQENSHANSMPSRVKKRGKRGKRGFTQLSILRSAIEYMKKLNAEVSTHNKSNAQDASRQ